jgi:uncharacterized protein YcbX
MLTLTKVYIYPIKGLPGILLNSAVVEPRGLQFDRSYMLVDENNNFITQRNFPILSQFILSKDALGFKVSYPNWDQSIHIPFIVTGDEIEVQVWGDLVKATCLNEAINSWFSNILKSTCKLVYMPNSSHRKLDETYNRGNDIVSFADGFPLLLIGESSLSDLNNRLENPLNMDRFRPNLVFKGGLAFEEDLFAEFSIGENTFLACKPCARCIVTTINQQTGAMGKEPLKTLATYRMHENKIYFGENVMPLNFGGTIQIGDGLKIISKKERKQFRILNSEF